MKVTTIAEVRALTSLVAWYRSPISPSVLHALGSIAKDSAEDFGVVDDLCRELCISREQREKFFYSSYSPTLSKDEQQSLNLVFQTLKRWEREAEHGQLSPKATISEPKENVDVRPTSKYKAGI